MATIKNTIELQDKMSASLKDIERELNFVDRTLKQIDDLTGTNSPFTKMSRTSRYLFDDVARLNDELKRTKTNTQQTNQEFKKFGKTMSVFKGTVLGSLAFNVLNQSVNGIKTTISNALTYASDLTEVQNVVDVTFGKSAQTINEWSKTTLDLYGLNTLSAKNYASTLGAMIKSSGITGDALLQMSMGLTQLTGDVASFRNLKPDEAFYKMQSVISGETEPLKQLGINMTEVNLEAYALSKGITTSYKAMTQSEKVMLRYNYVMELLTDTQGDFVRTSGSFANQSKLLSENWNEFAGTIANYVVPMLAILLQGLNNVIGFLNEHSSSVGIVLGVLATMLTLVAIKASLAGFTALKAGIQMAIAWLGALWPILAVIGVIGILMVVLNELGITTSTVVGFIVGLYIGLVLTLMNLVIYMYNMFAMFGNFLGNVFVNPVGAIKKLFYDLALNVIGFINKIGSAIETLLNKIPGVEVDITSGLQKTYDAIAKEKENFENEQDLKEFFKPMEFIDMGDPVGKAFDTSSQGFSNMFKGFESLTDAVGSIPELSSLYDDLGIGSFGTLGDDNVIDKVGTVGKIEDEVSITDEDIELLKDVAKVDYVNKFTTMNPQVNISFGDVKETADVNKITEVISEMIKESVATALV